VSNVISIPPKTVKRSHNKIDYVLRYDTGEKKWLWQVSIPRTMFFHDYADTESEADADAKAFIERLPLEPE
jgi:hypothetical protein